MNFIVRAIHNHIIKSKTVRRIFAYLYDAQKPAIFFTLLRGDLKSLLNDNFESFERLYESVVLYKEPALGRYPRHIKDQDSCDHMVEFPLITHVQTFPYGWAQLVQEENYQQYFRLEYCTK